MEYSDWKTMKLSEILDINPKVSLKKGEKSKKVAMKHLKEFTRKVQGYTESEFKSGSKFQNCDTLMARITPCLENGKTAFMDVLEDEEIAFGSTEFFVLRAKENVADSKFIYYLSISDEIRNVAIQSMTGTSGRQRAQKESLQNYVMKIPPFDEQKVIGKLLSFFDDKIELNNQIISNLEQLAQTLFKHWFVDFEFPNDNGEPYHSSGGKMVESELGLIPKGWGVGTLDKIVTLIMGQSPKSNTYNTENNGLPLINGASDFKNGLITPLKYTTDPKRISKKGDFIFGVRATVGNVTHVDDEYAIGRGVGAARAIEVSNKEFLYFQLIEGINYLESTASGSVYVNLSKTELLDMKIVTPDKKVVDEFHQTTKRLLELKNTKYEQNNKLTSLRDTLLLKLLSGELELPTENEVNDDVPIP